MRNRKNNLCNSKRKKRNIYDNNNIYLLNDIVLQHFKPNTIHYHLKICLLTFKHTLHFNLFSAYNKLYSIYKI